MRISPYKENVDNYSQDSAQRNPNRQFFQRQFPQNNQGLQQQQQQQQQQQYNPSPITKNSHLQDASNNTGSVMKLQSNTKQQPFTQRKKIFSVDEDNQSVSSIQQKKAQTLGQGMNSHFQNNNNSNNNTIPNRMSDVTSAAGSTIPPRSISVQDQLQKKQGIQSSQQESVMGAGQQQQQYVLSKQYQDLMDAKQASEETYQLEIEDTKKHFEFKLSDEIKKQQELVIKMQSLQQNVKTANAQISEMNGQLLRAEEEIVRLRTQLQQQQQQGGLSSGMQANYQHLQQQMQATIGSLQEEKNSLEQIISDGKVYIEKIKGESAQKSQQITKLKEDLIASQFKSDQNARQNEGNSSQIITMRTEIDKLITCNLELQKNLDQEKKEREMQSAEFSKMIGQQRSMNYAPAVVDDDSKQRKINELEMRLQQLVLKNGELTAESKTKQVCIDSLQKKFTERATSANAPTSQPQIVPLQVQQSQQQQQQQMVMHQPQYQHQVHQVMGGSGNQIIVQQQQQQQQQQQAPQVVTVPASGVVVASRPFGGLSQITEEVEEENYYLEMSRREKDPSYLAMSNQYQQQLQQQQQQNLGPNFNEIKRLRDEVTKQTQQISVLSSENSLLRAPTTTTTTTPTTSGPLSRVINSGMHVPFQQGQQQEAQKIIVSGAHHHQYSQQIENPSIMMGVIGSHKKPSVIGEEEQSIKQVSPYRNFEHKLIAPQQHQHSQFITGDIQSHSHSVMQSQNSSGEPTIVRQTLSQQRSVPDLRQQVQPAPISSFVISKPTDYNQSKTPSIIQTKSQLSEAFAQPMYSVASTSSSQQSHSNLHQLANITGATTTGAGVAALPMVPGTSYANPVSTSTSYELAGISKPVAQQQQQFPRITSNSLSFGSYQDMIAASNQVENSMDSNALTTTNLPWNPNMISQQRYSLPRSSGPVTTSLDVNGTTQFSQQQPQTHHFNPRYNFQQ